jgi:hypothetical protein
MAEARNTGTLIKDSQGNNATKTHLSTNIIIKVDGNTVGAVKSLGITESRSISRIPEVGTDGFIDSAPNRATEIGVRCSRTRFAGQRIAEAFHRGFVHASSQRIPFDIEIQDIFVSSDTANAIITVIENCWISNISYNYSTDDYVITEDMDIIAERIYSVLNSNNVVTSVGNGRAIPIVINQFEAQADRGEFTGALDAAGLLNAFLDDPTL